MKFKRYAVEPRLYIELRGVQASQVLRCKRISVCPFVCGSTGTIRLIQYNEVRL